MRNYRLFVPTIYLDRNVSIVKQLAGHIRGQWVKINGMLARIVNVTKDHVVLWMKSDNMVAVWK